MTDEQTMATKPLEEAEGMEQNEKQKVINTLEPEGEPIYEVDVEVDTGALYDYLLRHTYNSFSGLLGNFVGAFMILVFLVKDASLLYLIGGIVVLLYLPINLYMMAKKQSMQESFRSPIHYAFYANGVQVSQGEVRQMQRWEDMVKAVSTTKSIILYTGKNTAAIFPRRDLGEDSYGLIQVICTHMDPKKVKIKE